MAKHYPLQDVESLRHTKVYINMLKYCTRYPFSFYNAITTFCQNPEAKLPLTLSKWNEVLSEMTGREMEVKVNPYPNNRPIAMIYSAGPIGYCFDIDSLDNSFFYGEDEFDEFSSDQIVDFAEKKFRVKINERNYEKFIENLPFYGIYFKEDEDAEEGIDTNTSHTLILKQGKNSYKRVSAFEMNIHPYQDWKTKLAKVLKFTAKVYCMHLNSQYCMEYDDIYDLKGRFRTLDDDTLLIEACSVSYVVTGKAGIENKEIKKQLYSKLKQYEKAGCIPEYVVPDYVIKACGVLYDGLFHKVDIKDSLYDSYENMMKRKLDAIERRKKNEKLRFGETDYMMNFHL